MLNNTKEVLISCNNLHFFILFYSNHKYIAMKKSESKLKIKNPIIDNALHKLGNALLIVGRDDLIEFAKTCAYFIQAEQPKMIEMPEIEKPISQPEAVKFLGKSRQTLIKYRKKGIIQGHRLGGRIYYMPSQLMAALQKLS